MNEIKEDQQSASAGRNVDLASKMHQILGHRAGFNTISPRPAGVDVPVSEEQRRIMLHASLQPHVPIYNEPFTLYRHGPFSRSIFTATMNEIIARHEAWRTSFPSSESTHLHRQLVLTFPMSDLSGIPENKRESEALRIATEEATEPIAIEIVPLFRAHVVKMTSESHRIYFTFHHMILDGTSVANVFLPEFAAIYKATEEGSGTRMPIPLLQYGDYAIWQRLNIETGCVKKHLDHWRQELSGELPLLALPEDHRRPQGACHRGSVEVVPVPTELLRKLSQISRANRVTLYMMLLASYKVLLFRYSGQTDLIVGSVADARRRPELQSVMGNFVDTFAVRTKPHAELPFSEYLSQIRDGVLDGLGASDVPFDRVVREINPKRNANRHPVFEAFFSTRPAPPVIPHGWDISQTDVTVGATKFDLHLEIGESLGTTLGRLFYCTEIWRHETIERMARHWLVLLESICEDPHRPLGDLTMLTRAELDQLLAPGGWNDTAQAISPLTVTELIELQVGDRPHAVAAVFAARQWTYRELDDRADTIARRLQDVGATRGSIVAIALERSLHMLAGLLGVLKTGAAYLPIDLEMPMYRVQASFAEAKPTVILTERSLVKKYRLAGYKTVTLEDIDEGESSASRRTGLPERKGPVLSSAGPDDTAYLIFTSGTTGQPKAVDISHRSLVNLLQFIQRTPGFWADDGFFALTPISFDISVAELFLPLICGGRVHLASREQSKDPYLLADAIHRSGCAVLQATPSTWRPLLAAGWPRYRLPAGTRILSSGEPMSHDLADRLLATGAEVWNLYGPTETTIWSTFYRVPEARSKSTSTVSVGLPLANTTAFILDARLHLLPVNVPGELYLGGLGLAKGYRGQPEKSAQRFIQVLSVGGARLYRTGDLAVRRDDGTLEILGRTDNQVKVRGHRIELEAVEAALQRHPGVLAAIARIWLENSGDTRLSAYVVPSGSSAPTLREMRSFLESSVPEAMIPSDLLPIDSIPLNSNGKADRSRLTPPTFYERVPVVRKTSTPTEKRLGSIWADLLGRKDLGPEDNFFDMGGHSVLVARLQTRIIAAFGKRLSAADMFLNPTLRMQAELIDTDVALRSRMPRGVFALQPGGTRSPIFWMHYQCAALATALGDDQPFFSLELTLEDVNRSGSAPELREIVAHLTAKILDAQPDGPYIIGGDCIWGFLALEVAAQLKAAGHEVSRLILLDSPSPSYLQSVDSLKVRMRNIMYLVLKRSTVVGLRIVWRGIWTRQLQRFSRRFNMSLAMTEHRAVRDLVEVASISYDPTIYSGRVLLILASERASHWNFSPGWRQCVPYSLEEQYVNGHHGELLTLPCVLDVARVISSTLLPAGVAHPASTELIGSDSPPW